VGRAQLTVAFGEIRTNRELQITDATLTALALQPSPAVVARD